MNTGDVFLYGWLIGTLGTVAIYEWGGLLIDFCKLRDRFKKADKEE